MANDFDEFPLYDSISNPVTGSLSNVWISALSYFYQNLIGYLTQNGMLIPQLTIAQRNAIPNPKEGQLIYVTDATVGPPRSAEIQVWQVKLGTGAWRTVTTVP